MFYPVYIDPAGPRISEVGEPLPQGESSTPERRGVIGLLPIRKDGTEGNWQLSPAELRARVEQGRVRIGGNQTKGFVLYYLKQAEYQKVVDGTYPVEGTAPDGSLVLGRSEASGVVTVPTTQWRIPSHDSTQYGSRLLSNLIPDRRFPFPKSLYAVEDSLRFFCNDNPDAVVVDFFGGSGTTAHAVARLNHQDGGRRQSIVITNNEVSAAEADSLRKQGFRPGDPEWEALGIFEHVTRPRITSAVTGATPDGDPVKGDYRFTDEFPMAEGLEENVTFAELVYLDPDDVELGLAFAAVAPLLWLRAGAQGPIIEECLDSAGRRKPYAWTERYGVLFNPDRWRSFVEKMPTSATTAFVVTDSQAIFAGVTAELPDHLEVVRLYENYLTTFRINEGLG